MKYGFIYRNGDTLSMLFSPSKTEINGLDELYVCPLFFSTLGNAENKIPALHVPINPITGERDLLRLSTRVTCTPTGIFDQWYTSGKYLELSGFDQDGIKITPGNGKMIAIDSSLVTYPDAGRCTLFICFQVDNVHPTVKKSTAINSELFTLATMNFVNTDLIDSLLSWYGREQFDVKAILTDSFKLI